MPGHLVAVVVILTLLPEANHASGTVWLANLTLTQVCAADPDRRADPNVEPLGGGRLLPGAAHPGLPGLPAAGAGRGCR